MHFDKTKEGAGAQKQQLGKLGALKSKQVCVVAGSASGNGNGVLSG